MGALGDSCRASYIFTVGGGNPFLEEARQAVCLLVVWFDCHLCHSVHLLIYFHFFLYHLFVALSSIFFIKGIIFFKAIYFRRLALDSLLISLPVNLSIGLVSLASETFIYRRVFSRLYGHLHRPEWSRKRLGRSRGKILKAIIITFTSRTQVGGEENR